MITFLYCEAEATAKQIQLSLQFKNPELSFKYLKTKYYYCSMFYFQTAVIDQGTFKKVGN